MVRCMKLKRKTVAIWGQNFIEICEPWVWLRKRFAQSMKPQSLSTCTVVIMSVCVPHKSNNKKKKKRELVTKQDDTLREYRVQSTRAVGASSTAHRNCDYVWPPKDDWIIVPANRFAVYCHLLLSVVYDLTLYHNCIPANSSTYFSSF